MILFAVLNPVRHSLHCPLFIDSSQCSYKDSCEGQQHLDRTTVTRVTRAEDCDFVRLESSENLNYFDVNVKFKNQEATMSEIATQVAEKVGISPDLAEKAVGMMLGFLQREADDGPVAKMIESIPGATDLVARFNGEGTGGGGLLGGLMSAIGGGGIMGLGQQLMSEGLGMGEISALAKETIAIARQYAGDEVVDNVIASVPGLSQFA
jgi:hypothetical protein